MPDDIAQALDTARRVADLTERTLAPLLLALTGWRPEFRAIVLSAVGRRALALAAEAERLLREG
jgi:hypothetical protein